MPYMIVKSSDNTFCVHKQNDDKSAGDKMKCHPTEAAAKEHMAALYAAMPASESATIPTNDLQERQFDPNVGGGVDRDKMDASSFVYPQERSFPISKPGDVSDAVSSFGRSSHKNDFEGFKRRLIALCKRKGAAFVAALPAEWKANMTKENSPAKSGVFVESIDFSEAQVDTENRVLRGVTLIRAGMSKNRRNYSEPVLQAAIGTFEGVKAYANHPGKNERPERSVRDITGWYQNVRYESGALKADRYFTPNQAGNDVWALAAAIAGNKAPADLAGLSINAVGTGKVKDFADGEGLEVESITAANSVDDVTSPAAGGTYRLTASNGDELTSQLLNTLAYQEWFDCRPEFTERLKKEVQKVRLTDETKAQLAEANQRVKAAQDALTTEQSNTTQLQAYITALEGQNAKLLIEVETARGKLLLQETLERLTTLPATYKQDLRSRLPTLPVKQWQATIDTEISKAKRTDTTPKVPVSGADYRESAPIKTGDTTNTDFLLPRDNENTADWQERIKSYK